MCVYHILIYQDYLKGGTSLPPPPHFRDVIYVTWTSPPPRPNNYKRDVFMDAHNSRRKSS